MINISINVEKQYKIVTQVTLKQILNFIFKDFINLCACIVRKLYIYIFISYYTLFVLSDLIQYLLLQEDNINSKNLWFANNFFLYFCYINIIKKKTKFRKLCINHYMHIFFSNIMFNNIIN